MLPRERVFAALEHREPDRIPWGEHSIDYNVYEDILGRQTLVHAKMRETQASGTAAAMRWSSTTSAIASTWCAPWRWTSSSLAACRPRTTGPSR